MEMTTLDRKSRRRNADIKKILEERFQPIFGENRKEGIPLKSLIDFITDSDISSMPTTKLSLLLNMYDDNNDGLISFKEFTNLMLAEHERFNLENFSHFERFLLEFTATALPHSKQKEYITHYSCKPPPLLLIIISLIEVGCFVYYVVVLRSKGCLVDATNGISTWSPLIYNPGRRYEAWRFLTYAALHVGYMHLIVNLGFQLVLGIPLEMVHGWWRILLIYGGGAITGSLAHSVFDSYSYLAGASGGAYSIAAAHIANVVMNWQEMQIDWLKAKPLRFLLSAPVRLTFIIVIAGTDTGVAIYNKYWMASESENVGIAAHIGGMLTGLLLGIPVLKNIEKKPWETYLFYISLIIYIVLVTAAIFWNAFAPAGKGGMGYPATDWTPILNSTLIPPKCAGL